MGEYEACEVAELAEEERAMASPPLGAKGAAAGCERGFVETELESSWKLDLVMNKWDCEGVMPGDSCIEYGWFCVKHSSCSSK